MSTVQAIDMLMRLLVKPGDTVLLDDPCYFTMHTNLALHGVRDITIPRGSDRMDLEAFERLLIAHRPVLYMTLTANSRVSYAVLSPQLAARLVSLKMATGGMTSKLAEQIICTMLSDGSYAKNTRRTVDRL